MTRPGWRLVVTCEHGGHRVPARWAACFRDRAAWLRSHRGWDAGALEVARRLARAFEAPLVATTVTRLLVDANRSAGHPARFSEVTRGLAPAERPRIVADHWAPHRARVDEALAWAMAGGALAVHVACHSFVPVLDGVERGTDVGLLFDPRRPAEAALAAAWQAALRRRLPELRVRRNHPYRGIADGLPTALRRRHPDRRYAGFELEVSQALVRGPAARWRLVQRVLAVSLAEALAERAGLRRATAADPTTRAPAGSSRRRASPRRAPSRAR